MRPVLFLASLVLIGRFTSARPFLHIDSCFSPQAAYRESLKLPLIEPRILVVKGKRQLSLYSGGQVVRTYRVALGLDPVKDKVRARDMRTPEGDFYICLKNSKSRFYVSLELSYPNIPNAERGLRDGLISRNQRDRIVSAINRKSAPPQNTALGGEIFIHGGGAQTDWTWGCIALENVDIRELFEAVPVGTPVTVQH